MSKISKVIARQVFDSRGNPTIETEVFVKDISASAICPSGASTGTYEAFEKRDINNKKYLGKSVLKPVEFINKVISNKLKNFNVHQQEKIDNLLIRLDGTKQKKRVGGNVTWGQRFAAAKTAAHKLKNTATTKVNDYNRERMRAQKERERNAPDRNPWLTRNANLARQEALKIQEQKRQKARQGRNVYGNFNLGGPARRWTFR